MARIILLDEPTRSLCEMNFEGLFAVLKNGFSQNSWE
jgi:ABC-type sugar transport system ATPase subunit